MAAPAPDEPTVDTQQPRDGGHQDHRRGEPEELPVVVTPTSPSSAFALSRFEFEAGKGNEGTKILMVEWDTSAGGGGDSGAGEWEVSWEGKTTVLPTQDPADTETDDEGGTGSRRVYFLLPPGAPVPPLVSIAQAGTAAAPPPPPLRTRPMPAIFPAGLADAAGGDGQASRGVLHTIWAKKRLRELRAEIEREMRDNAESVGLEMAMQEQQWIVDQFGPLGQVAGAPAPTRLHIIPRGGPGAAVQGPASPRSPIGGKLGEKLRGLKGLATSPIGLAAATQAARTAPRPPAQPQFDSLSPGVSDVAVSSFGSMFPQGQHGTHAISNGDGGIASLDAVVEGGARPPLPAGVEGDVEEDLFALPMSPRSPEMKRSPFSML